MTSKEDRERYRKKIAENCLLLKVWRLKIAQSKGRVVSDERAYDMSKKLKEEIGDKTMKSVNNVAITSPTLTSADFKDQLRTIIMRWALLKTREHFWEEYDDFKQAMYWNDCPSEYRCENYRQGIKIPDWSTEVAELIINSIFWWLQIVYSKRYKVREDKWGRKWRSQGKPSSSMLRARDNTISVLQSKYKWYFY